MRNKSTKPFRANILKLYLHCSQILNSLLTINTNVSQNITRKSQPISGQNVKIYWKPGHCQTLVKKHIFILATKIKLFRWKLLWKSLLEEEVSRKLYLRDQIIHSCVATFTISFTNWVYWCPFRKNIEVNSQGNLWHSHSQLGHQQQDMPAYQVLQRKVKDCGGEVGKAYD